MQQMIAVKIVLDFVLVVAMELATAIVKVGVVVAVKANVLDQAHSVLRN